MYTKLKYYSQIYNNKQNRNSLSDKEKLHVKENNLKLIYIFHVLDIKCKSNLFKTFFWEKINKT